MKSSHLRSIAKQAGTWGTFVHKNPSIERRFKNNGNCPHCGGFHYFAFIGSIDWSYYRSMSHPHSLFECARCGAVVTSWDLWSEEWRQNFDREYRETVKEHGKPNVKYEG